MPTTAAPVGPSGAMPSRRALVDWLANLPTLALLILILVISTGEMVHGQLLKLGEALFSDPAQQVQYFYLRADPVHPSCNPRLDVEAEVARQVAQGSAVPHDDTDDLFGRKQLDPTAVRESVRSTLAECVAQHRQHAQVLAHITPAVQAYRTMETSFFVLFNFGAHNRALILLTLLLVTAAYTTWGFHHISLRPPRTARDHTVQSLSLVLAHGMMLWSAWRYLEIASASGAAMDDPRVHQMWILMFAVLTGVSAWRLWRPPVSAQSAETGSGSWLAALQCVPLVASMALLACLYFFAQGHQAGPAIYANKVVDIVSLPLALALHIWAGMLFKQSRLVDLFLNTLRPWRLSPQVLTYLILLLAGLPTAYAGVSSVFVIAAGAIVYHEVRAVGGGRSYALAASAMSGSLGVVLSPSLLVVGIAALNLQVTTAQLFHWGGYVFLLTSTMFFAASLLLRRADEPRPPLASPREAAPAMLREAGKLLPYGAVVALIVLVYRHGLDTPFNEISAPSILPILTLAIVVLDRALLARRHPGGLAGVTPADLGHAVQREPRAGAAIHRATTETVEHVGAYISLMVFTQLVSGVVERAELMSLAPQVFPNVWLAMGFLVVVKVVLGMVMEPLGAVLLVSSTLAPMAIANGIHPVHFWMMVLVAFELGYLSPPVAINQLLTRQVVGEAEIDRADAEVRGQSFYRRHERWNLPCLVMGLALLVVAFGPLAVQQWPALQPLFG
ncbi:TRAP transporter large permease subunit, partial [Aquabacterium sp.]|uniref:TRAP transporter large permease subunit n=1 Tax=Aquabacterium sp. TaxID=1872578 RepID=UPI0025BB10F9